MRWCGWLRRKQAALPRERDAAGVWRMASERAPARGAPYPLPHDMEELNRLDFRH